MTASAFRLIESLINAKGPEIIHCIIPFPTVIGAIAIGMVVLFFFRRCKSKGLDSKVTMNFVIFGGVAALIGARMFYVLLNLKGFLLYPKSLFAFDSGTASWGFYLGIPAGTALYMSFKKVPALPYLDVFGTTIPIGAFIGRWSCFFSGCCFGKVSDVPWAVCYSKNSLAFAKHYNEGLISYSSPLSLPVHPFQIYLSLNALFIFIFMTYFWNKYHQRTGVTFGIFCLVYGVSRFFIEFFRDVPEVTWIFGLNISQYMCIFFVAFSIFLIFFLLRRDNRRCSANIYNLKIRRKS